MIRSWEIMDTSGTERDIALLRELVAIDTTSDRSNRPAIDLACRVLDHPGIELIRMPVHEDKENLIAIVGTLDGTGSGLLLSGHLDCVPAGRGWASPAFELHERAGRLHARGACDMKGFDAMAINLVRESVDRGWSHPLAMVLTCDEEVGGHGARVMAQQWPSDRRLPTATVIGEPTSMRVVRMHKGFLKMRLEIRGASGHTGDPSVGRNAIAPVARAIERLQRLRDDLLELRTETSRAFGSLPSPVLTIVGVRGGSAWNMTPDHCALDVGLRLLPDQDPREWLTRLEDELEAVLEGEEWSLELINETPSMLTGPDSTLHLAACRLLGQDHDLGVSYGTDGAWLQRLGLECIVVGPGDISVAHQPDEYMPVDEYRAGRQFMESIIAEFCS
ncbi:MAG: acetylornithine deacetylase [Phycisphaerae bacterium]|nr:acetylornithine deacetylase [Phycisphaerae bacterium]